MPDDGLPGSKLLELWKDTHVMFLRPNF